MRKITEKAVNALLNGSNFKLDNTEVIDGKMFLFGNMIIEKIGADIWIMTAGWPTRTTLERLNGLKGQRIYKVKGDLFLGSDPWDGERRKLC